MARVIVWDDPDMVGKPVDKPVKITEDVTTTNEKRISIRDLREQVKWINDQINQLQAQKVALNAEIDEIKAALGIVET